MTLYDPRDWYWLVGGDASRAWSSARAAYVPADDPAYQLWQAGGRRPTLIASEAELREVLRAQYPAGWPPDPPAPIRRITPLAFRRRFPPGARGAITLAAAQALAAGDPTLQVWLDDLAACRVVDLDDPETRAGLDAVVGAGLLTAEQAEAAVADGTPAEAEGLAA